MKLKKELGLLYIFSITTGAMLSSGMFLLPGIAYAKAGPAVFLSYLFAGILAGAGMLSQAELATAMPKSGGTYYYVTRSMGTAIGTVYGIITMFALALKSAFELMAMAAFTSIIFHINPQLVAILLCLFFVIINIIGTKGASKIQVVLVFLILPALLIYLIFGFPEINLHNYTPFAPNGKMAIFATAGYVFVSFGGLLKVASIAEEVKNPGKVLPKGMIISLSLVILLYVSIIFVTTGILSPEIFKNSLRPISDSSAIFLGNNGMIALSIVAILGFASAANAGIMGASRYPLALSDDELFPKIFGKVNNRFNSPHNSILLTGVMIIGALFFELDLIIKAASSVLILTYIFSCLANIIMRESRLQNYQPSFKAPFYPWVQILGIGGFTFLLIEIGIEALLMTLGLITIGFIIYWFFGRLKVKREYALLHLVERITAKELTNNSLEMELKNVIRERDEIVTDYFDNLIENSIVLDLDKCTNMSDFFKLVSNQLSKKLRIDSNILYDLMLLREKDSSTALTETLAIPHIIIEGTDKFDILLARCKNGIYFSEDSPKVKVIFLLVGTKDVRNYHLKALAAIAQISQEPDFESNWLNAKDEHALRDIILLGKRKR
jgi:basic amino acid/polyamine antiporter, APA family